ncbi:MAG: hypothetical protein GVY32_03905 [Gammaproteobacteria bacterium]|jgi:hypothetical protein|nr:hypothetical protein [Gammaproteobacteria bacterium]
MNETSVGLRAAPGLDLIKWTAPAVMALMILAVMAFWPRYLSSPATLGTPFLHFHAITATLWFALLFTQPLLIRNRKPAWHRRLGYASLALAPLVVAAFVLAAHSQLGSRSAPDVWPLGRYILYLQLSLGALFGLFWLMGMLERRDRLVHARYMVATGLTFIDPVLARLLPDLGIPPQFVTFAVTDIILLALIWLERDARRGREVFPIVLALFLLSQLPVFMGLTDSPAWEAFAGWYLSLPLT